MTAATADAGWLRLYQLEIDDKPVAADLYFRRRWPVARLQLRVTTRPMRTLASGWCSIGMMIEDAANLGLTLFDFLRGNEAYKYRFGATDTPIWRVIAAPDADTVRRGTGPDGGGLAYAC